MMVDHQRDFPGSVPDLPRRNQRSHPWLPSKRKIAQRFSYVISQIAPLPPVVALNRHLNRRSQLDTLRFGTLFPKSH